MQPPKTECNVEVALDAKYMSFEEFSRLIDDGLMTVKGSHHASNAGDSSAEYSLG